MSQVAHGKSPRRRAAPGGRVSGLRPIMDSLVCLALAVVLFRTFQVEGYMISTGSMAPALLGFHKRVVCPTCRYEFAFGVAFDQDYDAREAEASGSAASPPRQSASCPHCGQQGIDISGVPRNQGDQLLVHKSAYLFQTPRRWQVAVFRNPYQTSQAYVKRIAGLPGESVEIRNGDLYADGRIQRKDLVSQRAMRVLVYDHAFEPQNDPAWQPRWVPDDAWQRDGDGFVRRASAPVSAAGEGRGDWDWVTYRHWVRSGGAHESSVELPAAVDGLNFPGGLLPIRYDATTRRLTATGVLSDSDRDRLLALSDDPQYATAIRRLKVLSHLAPVYDTYGYNRSRGGVPAAVVPDLMLSARVAIRQGTGQFAVQMTDGQHVYDLVLDLARCEARLSVDSQAEPSRKVRLDADALARPVRLEMSLFDRQVLVALDGQALFEPLPLDVPLVAAAPPRKPVRFGARGLDVRVDQLRLYRDVYYTSTGRTEPFVLGPDEYYVLGDNSPVSHDSRRWPDGAVNRRLFLGRPFIVHLPSRQLKLRLGGMSRYVRIPDFARIRYIR